MISRSAITFLLFSFSFFASSQENQQKEYPIVIRFVSEGAGVPDKKPVMDFVRSFQQKNKISKIKIDTVGRMGREGEYTLALSLDELTAKQKAAFIKKIKKVCKLKDDHGQIQYEENVTVNESKNPRAATPQTIKID